MASVHGRFLLLRRYSSVFACAQCVCVGERERRHVLGCVGEKPTFHTWMTCMAALASKAGRCRLARRYNVYSTHRNGTPVPQRNAFQRVRISRTLGPPSMGYKQFACTRDGKGLRQDRVLHRVLQEHETLAIPKHFDTAAPNSVLTERRHPSPSRHLEWRPPSSAYSLLGPRKSRSFPSLHRAGS